jgi:hypothetical protein
VLEPAALTTGVDLIYFVLRVIERAVAVAHVPALLYRWRTQTTSTGHSKASEVMEIMEVGGFGENFAVGFNDADLCLRIREAARCCLMRIPCSSITRARLYSRAGLAQHDRHVMDWVDHWIRSPRPPDERTARWLKQAHTGPIIPYALIMHAEPK